MHHYATLEYWPSIFLVSGGSSKGKRASVAVELILSGGKCPFDLYRICLCEEGIGRCLCNISEISSSSFPFYYQCFEVKYEMPWLRKHIVSVYTTVYIIVFQDKLCGAGAQSLLVDIMKTKKVLLGHLVSKLLWEFSVAFILMHLVKLLRMEYTLSVVKDVYAKPETPIGIQFKREKEFIVSIQRCLMKYDGGDGARVTRMGWKTFRILSLCHLFLFLSVLLLNFFPFSFVSLL